MFYQAYSFILLAGLYGWLARLTVGVDWVINGRHVLCKMENWRMRKLDVTNLSGDSVVTVVSREDAAMAWLDGQRTDGKVAAREERRSG